MTHPEVEVEKLMERAREYGGASPGHGLEESSATLRSHLTTLVQIAVAAEELEFNSYHRPADAHIQVTFEDMDALRTALAARKELNK